MLADWRCLPWPNADAEPFVLTRARGGQVMSRFRATFGALVLAQAAHSIEEYAGCLWESFPPARFLTGLISQDLELGFIVINGTFVAFGAWCWLWPVRRAWPSAPVIGGMWVVVELINGVGHPLWSLRQGAYTPGAATAPVLLILALYLAWQMRSSASDAQDVRGRPGP